MWPFSNNNSEHKEIMRLMDELFKCKTKLNQQSLDLSIANANIVLLQGHIRMQGIKASLVPSEPEYCCVGNKIGAEYGHSKNCKG